MNVELQINNSADASCAIRLWAPSPCRIRVTNPSGATGTDRQRHAHQRIGGQRRRGRVPQRYDGRIRQQRDGDGADQRHLRPFFVAGRFGRPSVNNGDVTIEARMGSHVVGSVTVMVRIRKNANTLTTGERDRFVAAFAQLNNQGARAVSPISATCTPLSARRRPTAPRDSCRGIAHTFSISNASFRRSIQASRCRTGASIDRRRTSSQLEFLGVSDRSAPSSSARPTRCSSGGRTACRASIAGRSSIPAERRRVCAQRGADTGARHAIPRCSGPWRAIRTDRPTRASAAPSPASRQLRRIRCSSCSTAMSIVCGRNGSDRTAASIRHWPPRSTAIAANPIGHNLPDTMWPWNGVTGRPASADGAGRRDGRVALRQRAGTAAARARQSGLPRCRQRASADGIRLRRCAVLTRLARGDEPWPRNAKLRSRSRSRPAGAAARPMRGRNRRRSRQQTVKRAGRRHGGSAPGGVSRATRTCRRC